VVVVTDFAMFAALIYVLSAQYLHASYPPNCRCQSSYSGFWISGTVSEILNDQPNLVRVSLSLVAEHASIDIIHIK